MLADIAKVVLAGSALLITSCASNTGPIHEMQIVSPTDKKIAGKHAAFFVQIPADGRYETKVYPGSGEKVASVIVEQIQPHSRAVDMEACSRESCASRARLAGSDYLVLTEIINWEDRQTTWSGRRDRVTLDISVIDLAENRVAASALLSGQGTLNTLGGERVEDELPDTIRPFIEQLFAP